MLGEMPLLKPTVIYLQLAGPQVGEWLINGKQNKGWELNEIGRQGIGSPCNFQARKA